MCAMEAGKRGRRVALLERAERIGKKILISGGGRCNFTNLHCRPENFLSSNPHFCKSALARYTPRDFIALIEKHGIAYHEKKLGQLFCDRSAQDVVLMLRERVPRRRRRDSYRCAGARSLAVIALCGARHRMRSLNRRRWWWRREALSIPKIGATAFGYELAKQFGIAIRPCRPALVPLVFGAAGSRALLRPGWRLDGSGRVDRQAAVPREDADHPSWPERAGDPADLVVLGPAPADCDRSRARAGDHGKPFEAARDATWRQRRARCTPRCRVVSPNDGWSCILPSAGRTRNSTTSRAALHRWEVLPAGTEGYEKAEVTAGGVDTDELSAKTMEARKVSGPVLHRRSGGRDRPTRRI